MHSIGKVKSRFFSSKFRSKSKTSVTSLHNLNCDNPNSLINNFSLVQSLRTYSNDLMSDIEMLINDKMV